MDLPSLWRPLDQRGMRRMAPLLAVILLLLLLAPGFGPAGRSLLLLAGCGALALVALRRLARGGSPPGPAPLRVVSKANLSPRSGIALVEADGHRYLVAFGDGFASMLAGTPAGTLAPSPAAGNAAHSLRAEEVQP